ncbi:MAG: FAD-dependent oxidoreductase [Candidatus Bipolaricaulia bacterium]
METERWLSPSERKSEAELAELVRGLYEYERVEEPKLPLKERFKDFPEIMRGYSDEEALAEATRCMQCQDAPCVQACPANLNVPGYCKAIVEGDLPRGLQIIMDTYPLPGSCGRVCFHPCTDVCLKGVEGEPINIPRLRRYLADKVDQRQLEYNIAPSTGKKVALIGSGPAGLTCAYHLLRYGHRVVVFEKDEKPGGTLNILPDYRLPNEVLQREVEVLEWLGVEIRTDSPISGEGCLDKLLEEYDAVFIGAGAIGSWKLDIPGKDLEGTMTALDYLRAVDRGESVPLGKSVAVIGGGDVAMDAVRTALRQMERVHFVYRRAPAEMPATGDEVIELGEEAALRELHHLEEAFAAEQRKRILDELKERYEHLTIPWKKPLLQSSVSGSSTPLKNNMNI